MPRYDFHCDGCDVTVEISLPFDRADEVQDCVRCFHPMRKVLIPAPAHFKGTGWGKDGG